jgi:hypothetical protein
MLGKLLSIGRNITPRCLMPLGHKAADIMVEMAVRRKHRRALPQILDYYEGRSVTEEQREVLDYLRKHGFNLFPYARLHTKKASDVQVFLDENVVLSYVMLDGKRLYYPADLTRAAIQEGFHGEQLLSQHPESPHRYLTDDFNVQADDIVVDCGAAEGNFALDVVDKVKKVYLFEPAERWQKPLNATFAPWKDKVVIVRKFLSDETNESNVSLDDYFAGNSEVPTMIKMDIEGYEARALQSAQRLLRAERGIRKAVVCTYHRQDDEQYLGAFLRECGFQTRTSKGFMLFVYDDDVKPPYLRRGIIRAMKG